MTDKRSKPTAADTWDEQPIDRETFNQLFDVLEAHPEYEVRPALQLRHEDSVVIKTIELLGDAETTMANFKRQVMFEEEPFDELTDEQIELLADHEYAYDTREEIREHVDGGESESSPPEPGTDTHEVLHAFEPGEVVTNKDLSNRVSKSIAFDGDAGAVSSFVGTLCDRGFVERTDSKGKPQYYRLTDRGEEVVSDDAE